MIAQDLIAEIGWPDVDDDIVGMDRYQIYRGYLQDGDVLEWSSNKLLGVTIRYFTGKDVNHTGAIMRNGQYERVPGDRVNTLEALSGGFQQNYLSHVLRDYDGRVYVLPLKSHFDPIRNDIVRDLLDMQGVGYDFGDLFKNALGHISSDARRLFCSEAVDDVLVKHEVIPPKLNKRGKRVKRRPGGFEDLDAFLPRAWIY